MNDVLAQKLKLLPNLPGCYLMKNSSGKIIYVGKAKILKNRVNSYFRGAHDYKTTKLVSQIADFDYIVTNTEKESLILESALIKQHRPRFNILLMDDKSYPYIKLTSNPLVRVSVSRDKKHVKGADYYGPYPIASAAHTVVDYINEYYPTQKCFPLKKKLCLYYHMGQCLGPCEKQIDEEQTALIKSEVEAILKGDVKHLLQNLTMKMESASENLNFELALQYKNQIESLKYITQKQSVQTSHHSKAVDVFNSYYYEGYLCIVGLLFRHGKMSSKQMALQAVSGDVSELMGSFLMQYYAVHEKPREVIVPADIDTVLYSDALGCSVVSPIRGIKREWLSMAAHNAKLMLMEKFDLLKQQDYRYDVAKSELEQLLGLSDLASLELVDVSHSAGEYPVGASVYFRDGVPVKENYRRFKLHQGNNDVASMAEMAYRKGLRHLKGEISLADVYVVDGGLLQVNSVLKTFDELGLEVPVIGLVKDDKHSTRGLIYQGREIVLEPHSPLYLTLALMQDEVHRFAIGYHRSVKLKKMTVSKLDEIRGLGQVRKEKLLRHFGSFKAINLAKLSEIQQIVGTKIGQMVYNQLMDMKIKSAKSIAVIDSGLGGYTIFEALYQHYPYLSLTFLADQKHAPFGNKSVDELHLIGKAFCEYCVKQGIVDVIVACNTLSSTVLSKLKQEYESLNLISIIDATLDSIKGEPDRIQVLATKATIESNVYQNQLRERFAKSEIIGTAAVNLAGLIEQMADESILRKEVESLIDDRADMVVLGCTHYPLIRKYIQDVMVVDAVNNYDFVLSLCKTRPIGDSRVLTTGDVAVLKRQLTLLFKDRVDVSEVEL